MISRSDPIEQMFLPRGLLRGRVLLLSADDAREMVAEAQRRGVSILGIDAFFVSEDSTRPSMEFSKDFTASSITSSESHRLADAHIARYARSGLLFEVVLEKHS